ncbi:hypothetical protein BGX20_000427 [Mortierella sp. AD010]|nr:hypothetical protein BGX20_000427 [Mortierella sp. AD010]
MEPWNAKVVQRLTQVFLDTPEKKYYAAYSALLCNVFTAEQGFTTSPQMNPIGDSRSSRDFAIEYEVGYQTRQGVDTPVMLLEVKRATDLSYIDTRISANNQSRARFHMIRSNLQVPTFIVISAIGTRCCVYRFNKATGQAEPPRILATDDSIVEDLAPGSRWSIDISTQAGRVELNNWFNTVKAMCASL